MRITIEDFKAIKEQIRECETIVNKIVEDAYEVALHGETHYSAELTTSDVSKVDRIEDLLITFGFEVDVLEWNFDNRSTVFEIRLKW